MTEHVGLSIPAQTDYLYLARLQVGAIASRADFSVDDVEDLHLAVEELCMSVLHAGGAPRGRLWIDVAWDEADVEVRCSLEAGDQSTPSSEGDAEACFPASISERLLDALVDSHGLTTDGGRPVAWLKKGRRT